MYELRIRARAYAGKRRKLGGNGGCRDGRDVVPHVANRVGISVEGGKERQHKTHKTTQNNNNGTHAHTHTHTHTHTTNTRATEHGTMTWKST